MFTSYRRNHTVAALVCLWATLVAAPAARAAAIGGTFIAFSAPYKPTENAQYLRLLINNQAATKVFDNTTIDTGFSTLTIRRGAQRIYVPIANSATSQLAMGMTQAKPGFIDFRPPGGFKPGDRVNVTLLFTSHVDFKTSGGLWRDGTGAANDAASNIGSLKIPSETSIFDPIYSALNDLDPGLFSGDAPFTEGNLSFLGNQTQSQLDALMLEDLEAGIFPSGTSPTSTFELLSSQSLSDPLLYSREFLNPYVEPAPGMYDIAMGQYNDPDTGTVQSAFIHAFLAAPEPGSFALVVLALVALLLAPHRRDRPGMAGACGQRLQGRYPARTASSRA